MWVLLRLVFWVRRFLPGAARTVLGGGEEAGGREEPKCALCPRKGLTWGFAELYDCWAGL